MYPIINVTIRTFERGLLFREGELSEPSARGTTAWDPLRNLRADVSRRASRGCSTRIST